ncbi:MAG: hypothetical protein ONB14_00750 [candidate division KSB1 bacterium]|nr:hypothetical protein [candidate division KSB1 bacterium]
MALPTIGHLTVSSVLVLTVTPELYALFYGYATPMDEVADRGVCLPCYA